MEVFVVRFRQLAAVMLRLCECWRAVRNSIGEWKRGPALFRQSIRIRYRALNGHHGRITVLISLVRRIIP